ncbi:YadA C-terminal domain-containing protein [Enterobacter chuandaensis]|uniref:YadA C-terminal domain-containing protein n=1 Tax=Enterobacter chuandaensis TaxID=2497875 RepID=A0AA96M322_9ENTR|nr:YadA C-terminal domain-containing protein [Enterobacter chuandaensis]MCW4782509.1 YadA C-terminal domain-containing protein [Enterobacter chuandaensis]MDA4761749.1 YadA C-terminal domain-containing protein [Enterobacter chuandaensis]WNS36555.1 YadA C-terminal domain-containing protein [Enterobacter chuandaensis]
MKLAKNAVTFFVSGVILTGSINVTKAADVNVNLNDNVSNAGTFIQIQGTDNTAYNLDNMKAENATQDGQIYNLQGDRDRMQDEINVSKNNISTNTADISSLQTTVSQVDQDAKLAGALADTANTKGDVALKGVLTNGTAITHIETVNAVQDSRLLALENAPKPTNGVDGKDGAKGDKGDTGSTGAQGVAGVNGRDGANGKDGVMTTVTRTQVDTATQAKVATNSQAITAKAQELQATKQTLQALNNNTNQQFRSLREEVDNNKKEANAGISGAMAMAGLPQVQTNQRVMFSAGGATYNGESALAVGASVNFNEHMIGKVSFSDDTANNMGASVGVGIGF